MATWCGCRASHWLHHEEPEEVSSLLLEFFGAPSRKEG
jgi:hypothetical protein